MFSIALSRAWFARSALVSLVAASVLVAAPPAHAAGIGNVSPESVLFDRNSTTGSVVIHDGESMDVTSSIELSPEWTGWPLKKGAKLTRTAFVVTPPAALPLYDTPWRQWSSPYSDICDGLWDNAAAHTISIDETCVDDLQVTDSVWLRNDTGSDQTIATNANSQVLKNGKTNLTAQPGVDKAFYGTVNLRQSSVTLASGDSNLRIEFRGCIDESLLTDASQDLTVALAVTRGGSTLTKDTDYYVYDNGGGVDTDAMTYTTTSASDYFAEWGTDRENVEVSLEVAIDAPTSGTAYTGTLDVKNGSNQSVLEECPIDGVADWGTVSTVNNGQPDITQNTRSLPGGVDESNSNFDLYYNNPDGFGGQFYWTLDADNIEDIDNVPATIVHLGSSGPSNSFNGTGSIGLTTGSYGQIDMGRYDVNGTKWYAITAVGKDWTLSTGSMTAGGATSTSLTNKNMSKLCPAKFTATFMMGTPAPTASPLAFLQCTSKALYSYQIVSLSSATPTLITSLGTTSSKAPCVVPIETANPLAASSTDIALFIYTRVSGRDANGYCGSIGANVSSRALTRITQAGVATKATLTGNPWNDGVEPSYMEIAPTNSAGTDWIGISFDNEDMWSPTIATGSFTATTTAITANSAALVLDPDDDFGDWAYVQPVKKVNATAWLVAVNGEHTFDGETTARYTVGVFNPSTGEIANGDIGELDGFGYYSGRVASRLSIKRGDAAYWYAVTSTSNYSASSWSYTP